MRDGKKIQLAYPYRQGDRNEKMYKVVKITNSTAYHPGDLIPKSEVARLCQGMSYDVTIVQPKSSDR